MNDDVVRPLEDLEKLLQYKFTNMSYLQEALVHSSHAYECNLSCSNERLELLGDAVLHLVITEYIMLKYPEDDEGQLSALRSYCESEIFLYELAQRFQLGEFISLGKGETLNGGRQKESVLADTLEAVIAAIYLDGGYSKACSFIVSNIEEDISDAHDYALYTDSKSELQKLTQKRFNVLPVYTVIEESGMEHKKSFMIRVSIDTGAGEVYAMGAGKNKKNAGKDAARKALELLS